MNDEIECDGDAMAPEPFEDTQFLAVRPGVRDFRGNFLPSPLEAELEMVEAGFYKRLQPLFVERKARRDEIDVKPGSACGFHEIEQIRPGEWFAAREIHLQNTKRSSFAEDAQPTFGREFGGAGLQL